MLLIFFSVTVYFQLWKIKFWLTYSACPYIYILFLPDNLSITVYYSCLYQCIDYYNQTNIIQE